LVSFNLIFVSCNRDEITEDQTEQKLSGEELFKSIIFVDGKIAPEINALSNVSKTSELSNNQLIEYRNLQNDFIKYVKQKDTAFFNDFQNVMYSKNPEIISSQIKESAKMLLPWLNSRLAVQGLSVEKLKQEMKKNNISTFQDISNINSKNPGLCISEVLFFGIAVVAVAVVLVGVAYWTVADDGGGNLVSAEKGNNILLNSVSIQIAEIL
jgi:SdpC family antimicrobial peptide